MLTNMKFVLICTLSVLCLTPHFSDGANILGIFPFPGKSHSIMYNIMVEELVARGHDITMITNFPIKNMPKNYKEILIRPMHNFWKDAVKTNNLFELNSMTFQDVIQMVYSIGLETTTHALERPEIQDFLHNNTDKFDLLLTEQFFQEPILLFAHKYQIPIVTVSTLGYNQYMYNMMGGSSPWAHVPHEFLEYNDRMTFFERIHNVYAGFYEEITRRLYYWPKQAEIAEKYFSHLQQPIPTIYEMQKKVSLILLNSYVPLLTVRPTLMNMVAVGGVHIKAPQVLPSNMQTFLDEAKDGVIYFSLGTNLRSADIHPDKMRTILTVFSQMKQRVLWKFENEDIKDLPENIMVKSWMPQNDILAHPNVRVFITHGGLLGTQEAVYHGVPMIGIPVYADQFLNVNKAQRAGFAIQLFYPNITETSLKWALNELLENPKYTEIVRGVSKQFRGRPIPPLNESIYWIEYIIEHKGADHIQSSAKNMSWFSFMLLDIMLFFVVIAGVLIYLISAVLSKFRKPAAPKSKKNKKQ